MPALQKGSTYFTAKGAGVRWIEDGRRIHRSGFASKTEARRWWQAEIAPRLRAGVTTRDVTLREHVERYLAVHPAAARTRAKLREDLGLPEREPKQPRQRTYRPPSRCSATGRSVTLNTPAVKSANGSGRYPRRSRLASCARCGRC